MLRGKRTIIAALVLAVMSAVATFDATIHGGKSEWLTPQQYAEGSAFLAGLVAAFMRLALKEK